MSPRLLHKTICRVFQSMQEGQVLKQSPMVRPSVVHSLHCGRLRTVANDFERLRTVANGCGRQSNLKRTHLHPQTPKDKREPYPPSRHFKGKMIMECRIPQGTTCPEKPKYEEKLFAFRWSKRSLLLQESWLLAGGALPQILNLEAKAETKILVIKQSQHPR